MPTTPDTSSKTQQTYTAAAQISIDGDPAPEDLLNNILHLVVEESLSRPGMFTFVVRNSASPGTQGEKMWAHEDLLKIGKTVSIGFRSNSNESQEFAEEHKGSIFAGEITAIETHFTEGSQAPIVIRGYDVSHRLHRGRFNRSFQKMSDSAILKKIVAELNINFDKVEETSIVHDYVFQENQTNMEFLRERAARNGFELFVQDGILHFRKPKAGESLELAWLKHLTAFQVCVNSAEQVETVEVRGWDYTNKKTIVAQSQSGETITQNQHGKGRNQSHAFQEQPKGTTLTVVNQPMFVADEAKTMAQGLFNELEGQYIQADAKAQGDPRIRVGKLVKLKNMGKYEGEYYITNTRHVYSERHYTTEFSVRGLRGGDLLSIVAPPVRLQPGQTFLVGIVTNNKDPQAWGRVRVKFPTLTEDHESNWARVVTIGAGAGRGFDCLPEINDEVLVGFEHGDIHRPYIIGNVWNGKDAPPEKPDDAVSDGKVRLRTFKTRTGHQLQFTEENKGSSKKGIQIKSVYGHQIHMNDSEQLIEITTPGGHSLKMDDKNHRLELKSATGHKLVLDDAAASVSLKSSGSLSIEANTTMKIQSNGPLTVQGAIIKLN
jgi:phage protein D/phage baseplate assembly protein gpV